MTDIAWGPSGRDVYERTYSRTKTDGTKEAWPDTVHRVATGNLQLVDLDYDMEEHAALSNLIEDFSLIPAGRHLWATGVKGRQFITNCWVAPWGEKVSEHFTFTFMRLMEGGGVGATYSTPVLRKYGPVGRQVDVHIVCDPEHPDYGALLEAGLISTKYSSEYLGAYTEVEDSREGWAAALEELLESAWIPSSSEILVFDVSRVRPAGSRLKTFGGYASGPEPLARMLKDVGEILFELYDEEYANYEGFIGVLDPISALEIDHAIAQCVVAGGNRRSARMSIMPWDDPYILEFVDLKEETGSHWTTNISVQVDDDFFYLLNKMDDNLAKIVLRSISEGMLLNGEPGIWNKSLSNVGEVHEVTSTNPCSEICLPEYGACVLGHINLEAFAPKERGQEFNIRAAARAAQLMTRFLIRATYGSIDDPGSRDVMDRDRRIGVGLFGFQAAFARMGIPYSEIPENPAVKEILNTLYEVIRREARDYAFELRIPEPIKVTTVAPTGTIAKLPGTTEGIHPIFARHFIRRIRFSTVDPEQARRLEEFREEGYHVEPCLYAANTMVVEIPTRERLVDDVVALGYDASVVESADEISLHDMLRVQETVQEYYADNAVSFTANIDPGRYDVIDVYALLKEFGPSLKGSTIFPDKSRPQSPYERISEEEFNSYLLTQVGEGVDEECATSACPVR